MMKPHSLLCVLSAVMLASPVSAAPQGQTMQRPPRLGMCAACHGEHGIALVPGVPNLAGQRLDYLRDALAQYRSGKRDVAVMRAALGPLNAKQVDALARWYAAQPAAGSGVREGDRP